jgi:hypothetical protein
MLSPYRVPDRSLFWWALNRNTGGSLALTGSGRLLVRSRAG